MRLEEICTVFTDGDWIESKDQSDDGIRLVQTGNIGEGIYLEKEARAKYISEETFEKLKCTEIFPGDILVSRLPDPVGRACIIPEKEERMITAVDCTICRPNESIISKEYLCYFMRSSAYYKRLLGSVTGTTRKRISRKNLGNVELEVPSKERQMDVVEQLDCLVKVIESRKQELQLLDNLIKARFVEMFGDPVVHLYKGETVKLDTIADKITVGFVGEASNEYVDEGVPYLRTQNIRVNRIDLKGLIYVNESFHNKNQKSIIHPGDVVISRVGANRGMAAMVPDSLPEANIANCLIVGQTDNINSYYLAFYMNMSFGKRPQFGASVGSAQGVVNTSILKKWEVYVPDRKLQDDFFEFSNQVDKSKVAVQKALKETQLLFDSLMQQYFG